MTRALRLTGRFLGLSYKERIVLSQAAVLLAGIRLALRVVPFATLRRILARLATSGRSVRLSEYDHTGRSQAVWAVEAVGRHWPAIGTCLTQALAAHVLMGRMGHKSDLRIGVTRSAEGTFVAHAWLEDHGTVIIGGACHTAYTPMPVLNGLDPRVPASDAGH
jgi:hypothetical protein